jgi:hypothetical protein
LHGLTQKLTKGGSPIGKRIRRNYSAEYSLDDMAGREEILKRWNFPHRDDHGVTLVARQDAPACVERIIRSACRFYGYDSFIVRGQTIQPVMELVPTGRIVQCHLCKTS